MDKHKINHCDENLCDVNLLEVGLEQLHVVVSSTEWGQNRDTDSKVAAPHPWNIYIHIYIHRDSEQTL
jgi:hypothetical protein